MISAQTLRVCREGKPVPTFPDHALADREPGQAMAISAQFARQDAKPGLIERWIGRESCALSLISNRGRDLVEPNDAGELAHFFLLVFAELEQQRHRRRFQLLDLFGIRIDL